MRRLIQLTGHDDIAAGQIEAALLTEIPQRRRHGMHDAAGPQMKDNKHEQDCDQVIPWGDYRDLAPEHSALWCYRRRWGEQNLMMMANLSPDTLPRRETL